MLSPSAFLMGQTYTVKTFAGVNPSQGAGTQNQLFLNAPEAVAMDKAGNTYLTDTTGHRVIKLDPMGNATIVIGNGGLPCAVYDPVNNPVPSSPCTSSGGGGGPMTMGKAANTQPIGIPDGLAIDQNGNLFIADRSRHRIYMVDTSGVVTLIAGSTNNGRAGTTGDGRTAIRAELDGPRQITFDAAGNLYIADTGNARIRMIAADSKGNVGPNSIITTVAGALVLKKDQSYSATCSYTDAQQRLVSCGDGGKASQAGLNAPEGVVVSADGTIFIADTSNNRIRVVCTQTTSGICNAQGFAPGTINTLAGRVLTNFELGLDANGQPIKSPGGAGNLSGASAPYPISCSKPTPGSNPCAPLGDGRIPTGALLASPAQLAFDQNGNLLIADRSNHRIRLLNLSTYSIGTVAGTCSNATSTTCSGNTGDGGTATLAFLNNPDGLFVDGQGNILFSDRGNNRIRMVNASGIVVAVAGANRFNGDQLATATLLNGPTGIARDSAGNIYFADSGNNIIRKVDTTGNVTTIAGAAGQSCSFSTSAPFTQVCGDGGPTSGAKFNNPSGIAVDPTGTIIYIADTANNRVRKITAGQISTVAGGCTNGWGPGNSVPVGAANGFECPSASQNGLPATSYVLNFNNTINDSTSTYNFTNGTVQATTNYTICTQASGVCTSNNGLNNNSRRVAALALDGAGNLYMADISNSVIRVMTTDGNMAIVAGTFQAGGSAGDGGPATQAFLANPTGVVVSQDGKYLFWSENTTHVVRMVAGGVVYPVAGEPNQNSPDGESSTLPAYNSRLLGPSGLCLFEVKNPDGSLDLTKTLLFLAGGGANTIVKINLTTFIQSRVAGNQSYTGGDFSPNFFGDGVAGNLAQLNYPTGCAVDSTGNVYFTDAANNLIRSANLPGK
jgi:sugar lactone lactonase YvrE